MLLQWRHQNLCLRGHQNFWSLVRYFINRATPPIPFSIKTKQTRVPQNPTAPLRKTASLHRLRIYVQDGKVSNTATKNHQKTTGTQPRYIAILLAHIYPNSAQPKMKHGSTRYYQDCSAENLATSPTMKLTSGCSLLGHHLSHVMAFSQSGLILSGARSFRRISSRKIIIFPVLRSSNCFVQSFKYLMILPHTVVSQAFLQFHSPHRTAEDATFKCSFFLLHSKCLTSTRGDRWCDLRWDLM